VRALAVLGLAFTIQACAVVHASDLELQVTPPLRQSTEPFCVDRWRPLDLCPAAFWTI
jgi:hypothetical protein